MIQFIDSAFLVIVSFGYPSIALLSYYMMYRYVYNSYLWAWEVQGNPKFSGRLVSVVGCDDELWIIDSDMQHPDFPCSNMIWIIPSYFDHKKGHRTLIKIGSLLFQWWFTVLSFWDEYTLQIYLFWSPLWFGQSAETEFGFKISWNTPYICIYIFLIAKSSIDHFP